MDENETFLKKLDNKLWTSADLSLRLTLQLSEQFVIFKELE